LNATTTALASSRGCAANDCRSYELSDRARPFVLRTRQVGKVVIELLEGAELIIGRRRGRPIRTKSISELRSEFVPDDSEVRKERDLPMKTGRALHTPTEFSGRVHVRFCPTK
jgi:hypothetical protein